jgi:hypothetical protein
MGHGRIIYAGVTPCAVIITHLPYARHTDTFNVTVCAKRNYFIPRVASPLATRTIRRTTAAAPTVIAIQ